MMSIEELTQILAATPSLLPMVEHIALAADSPDVAVLLTGEPGTGKTHLARLIHDCSPRKEHRFLVVPCGMLAANLVESELFGHEKGAFTGADERKTGKFPAAGNGTVLLYEIHALGLGQQDKLLQVMQTGEYKPVGSNETQHCTARIMAASNWNLEEFYSRLNVMSFHLPPLRERVQDIAPLVRTMLQQFAGKFRKKTTAIHPVAMAALEAFHWPGNVRQLQNVMQQAVLVSSAPLLESNHLPSVFQKGGHSSPSD